MARKVNPQEYAEKRNQILDVATRLVFTKGYERMAIGDILSELNISSGAFYHYFESKPALLEAFIERIKVTVEGPLLPILHNPHLSAVEKLQGFFDTLAQLRMAHRTDILSLSHIWYTDENAIVRQKVDQAVFEQRAPLLTKIVRLGVQEGVFTVSDPDRAGEVILSLLQGMGNTHAALLLAYDRDPHRPAISGEIVAVHAAYMEAVERVLGAPPNSLYRADAPAVETWLKAIRENHPG